MRGDFLSILFIPNHILWLFSTLTDAPYTDVTLTPNSQNDFVVFYLLKFTVSHIHWLSFPIFPVPHKDPQIPTRPPPAST